APIAQSSDKAILGSACAPMQLTAVLLNHWCEVLASLPQYHFQLADAAYADESICQEVTERFHQAGLERDRLKLVATVSRIEAFEFFQGVDLVVDPYPVCSPLAACDALWLGVPVITCEAETLCGRITTSILRSVGEVGYIAKSLDEYRDLVIDRAQQILVHRCDAQVAGSIRQRLHTQMAQSIVCDARRFAQSIQALLTQPSPPAPAGVSRGFPSSKQP
ncbi:MAG: hypothetical protein IT423_16225, partial [Pirellulaceae bacterium]|nr:hypothetical protein [Pirellulaceae bacterium]